MQMDDGSFLKWATGTITVIFVTIFGSYKFTQGQIDKHKEAVKKDLDAHKATVHSYDCVEEKTCKEDRDHLAEHMKRMADNHAASSKAIFKEIKSLNDKFFKLLLKDSNHGQ